MKIMIFITLLVIGQSCVAIYKDLSTQPSLDLVKSDLKTGIVISIPMNQKVLVINMVNIDIYQDSQRVESRKIPWYSNTSFSLDKGEYTLNTFVRYMNYNVWKTTSTIRLSENEIKNILIKYPFWMTGKPKVTIK
jgi:hypothetical protein